MKDIIVLITLLLCVPAVGIGSEEIGIYYEDMSDSIAACRACDLCSLDAGYYVKELRLLGDICENTEKILPKGKPIFAFDHVRGGVSCITDLDSSNLYRSYTIIAYKKGKFPNDSCALKERIVIVNNERYHPERTRKVLLAYEKRYSSVPQQIEIPWDSAQQMWTTDSAKVLAITVPSDVKSLNYILGTLCYNNKKPKFFSNLRKLPPGFENYTPTILVENTVDAYGYAEQSIATKTSLMNKLAHRSPSFLRSRDQHYVFGVDGGTGGEGGKSVGLKLGADISLGIRLLKCGRFQLTFFGFAGINPTIFIGKNHPIEDLSHDYNLSEIFMLYTYSNYIPVSTGFGLGFHFPSPLKYLDGISFSPYLGFQNFNLPIDSSGLYIDSSGIPVTHIDSSDVQGLKVDKVSGKILSFGLKCSFQREINPWLSFSMGLGPEISWPKLLLVSENKIYDYGRTLPYLSVGVSLGVSFHFDIERRPKVLVKLKYRSQDRVKTKGSKTKR